jgi:hypothetical protein
MLSVAMRGVRWWGVCGVATGGLTNVFAGLTCARLPLKRSEKIAWSGRVAFSQTCLNMSTRRTSGLRRSGFVAVPRALPCACGLTLRALLFRTPETQATREKVHTSIKTKLDASIVSRTKADEKFQSFVSEELAAIKNSIRVEAQVRSLTRSPLFSQTMRATRVLRCVARHGCVRVPVHYECQMREKEDDEIVETMNRYSQKLQASLHIINSADTE